MSIMKKLVLVMMMVLSLTGCRLFSNDFKDQQVQHGVDQALRQMGLSRKDYDQITHLDLSFLAVEDLQGIDQLVNLESLDISDNQISDLGPLERLESLKILDLQNNYVEDLSPISQLESLEILLIRNNPIESIQVLEPIFGQLKTTDFLTEINFKDEAFQAFIREEINKVNEQITYYDLEKIKHLDLTGQNISDISGIEHAHQLETLIIPYSVKGLNLISGLEHLKYLQINDARIGSLSFIQDLNNLVHLDLKGNLLEQVQVIGQFKNLEYLDISYNKISDLSPINALENLKTLLINGNYISNYDAIEGVLSGLEKTDAYIVYFQDANLDQAIRNHLNKPEGLVTKSELKSIKSLNVSNSGIDNLGGIELLENLVDLNISYNNIQDLDDLQPLEDLKILKASNNEIQDIEAIKYLSELEIIDLKDNLIESIEALTYLNQLEYLLLEGNPIDDPYKEALKEQVKFTDEW